MKYFYKFLSVIAIVTLLAGCAKEQSSFKIEDIQGSAIIKGKFQYNAGYGYDYDENKVITSDTRPLANHVVYAEITNSSLRYGAEGVTILQVSTDANGNYTLYIPATYEGTDVKVYPKTFTTIYRTGIDHYELGDPIFKEVEALFEGTKKTFSGLCPNDIKFYDSTLTYTSLRTN